MIYHEDWFMRQIRMVVQVLLRLLTGREEPPEALWESTGENALRRRLAELLEDGQVCGAEDLLWEVADGRDMDALYAGLWLYETLSHWQEAQLLAGDFSREEILQGLAELARRYGPPEGLLGQYFAE